jgi:hypothetical protein
MSGHFYLETKYIKSQINQSQNTASDASLSDTGAVNIIIVGRNDRSRS